MVQVSDLKTLLELRSKTKANSKELFEFVCTDCGLHSTRRIANKENNTLLCSKCFFKQNFKIKYGVENPSQLKVVKEKKKQTSLDHYGTENPMQSEKVSSQFKGKLNPMKKEEMVRKCLETRKAHFDSVSYKKTFRDIWDKKTVAELGAIAQKRKQTSLQRYGDENFNNRPLADLTKKERYGDSRFNNIEKAKQTCLKRYGVESTFSLDSVKEKIKQTCLEKYGVPNYQQDDVVKQKIRERIAEAYAEEFRVITSQYGPVVSVQQASTELDLSSTYILDLCKKYTTIKGHYQRYIRTSDYEDMKKYVELTRGHGTSAAELELRSWVSSICTEPMLCNDKTITPPYELDIYIPSKHVAIEYNGLYWHSDVVRPFGEDQLPTKEEKDKAKTRHLKKTVACEDLGIRLIHIFEDDWLYKQDICKSILAKAVGVVQNRIFARVCTVKELDLQTYRQFLIDNHLQGYSFADVRLGLWYKDTLVQCIGILTKGNHSKKPELVRMCVLKNTAVVGGFSRLLAHSGFDCIDSYVDRGTFDGSGYAAVGFKEIKINPPTYFYIKQSSRKPRYIFMKKNMGRLMKKGVLHYFNPDETEETNMYKNGYGRIWNCGTIKVRWQRGGL